MTVRGTVALLGLFAVLAAYLMLVAPPAARLPPLGDPLLAVPAARVTSLEIVWPDRRLRATRESDGWRLDGGAAFPAGVVEDLLATLTTLRPMERLAGNEGTADYGLGSPGTSLVLLAGDTTVLQLEIGSRNPAWTGVYVRRTGAGEIELVGALLHWEVEKLRAIAPG